MPISVFERRKYVRINVNLESCLNNETRGVIKTLGLGGCSIEAESLINIDNPVCIKIFSEGKIFEVEGDVIYSLQEKSYAICFNHRTKEQNLSLIELIENTHKTSDPKLPTRVSLKENAILDREPALISNISEGGCFIQTSASFNRNDIVELQFRIMKEEIHLAGQVRWVEPRGIGIQFISLEPFQISTISRYVSLKLSSSPAFS